MNASPTYLKYFSHRRYWLQIVALLIFTFSGLASVYLYYQYYREGGAFLPGLLYTTATIVIFLLSGKTCKVKSLLLYYLFMNLTYVVLLLLTYLSAYVAFLTGIVSGALGAYISVRLTSRYITPLQYKTPTILLAGGLAFASIDIIYFYFTHVYDKLPMEKLFGLTTGPQVFYIEVLLLWQMLVGSQLFRTLNPIKKPNYDKRSGYKKAVCF